MQIHPQSLAPGTRNSVDRSNRRTRTATSVITAWRFFCGYLAGYFGVLGTQNSEALNRFVYYFALPALLFIFVARAPLGRILYWPFLAAWGASLALTFGLTALLARLVYRDRLAVVGLRSMNATFANTGYMGIPLAITAFGEAAGLPAIIATAFMGIVFQPAIAWLLLAAVFKVEPLWATVTILIAGLPTGANCFVLAQRYNVFVAPTSATILLSTALSVVTVSLLLILLR